ncbi:MAG: hypothetical protein ACR2NA_04080 [Solirubrobacterales bacterium]
MTFALGIDGASGEWVGIRLLNGKFESAGIATSLKELRERLPAEVVGIDGRLTPSARCSRRSPSSAERR